MSVPHAIFESLVRGCVVTIVVLASLPLFRGNRPAIRAALMDLSIIMLALAPWLQLAGLTLALPLRAPVASTVVTGTWAFAALPRIMACIYLLGAAAGLVSLAISVVRLVRISRRARPVRVPAWRTANFGLALRRRAPRLRTCRDVPCVLSWGWRTGTILLDPATLAQAQHAPAILAHEHAHLRRLDWPLLIVARMVLALNWCNPLVWMLVRVRARAVEEAADAAAIRTVDSIAYAEALLHAARRSHGLVAMAMATASNLRHRVSSVLEGSRSASPLSVLGAGFVAAMVLAVATVDPGAATRIRADGPARQTVPETMRVPVPVEMDVPVPVPVPVPMDDR